MSSDDPRPTVSNSPKPVSAPQPGPLVGINPTKKPTVPSNPTGAEL